MENPKIVKVLHGGANDIRHYQRDFRAFPRAIIDTQQVYHYTHRHDPDYIAFLENNVGNRIGFKKMAKKILANRYPSDYPEDLTLVDWRIFPLPPEMIKYAQYDTSLLMMCWQELKDQMRDLYWQDHVLNPITASNHLTAAMYKFPNYENCESEIAKEGITPARQNTFRAFWKWRLERARYVDEPLEKVLSL